MATINITVADGAQTNDEVVGLGAVYDPSIDSGYADTAIAIQAAVSTADNGAGNDLLSLVAAISTEEAGLGIDRVGTPAFLRLYVRQNGFVEPLGVILLEGTAEESMPSLREASEIIPGRDGEIHFGTDIGPRALELRVGASHSLTDAERIQLKRHVSQVLRPALGEFGIAWEADPDRYLQVRVAGAIEPTEYRGWLEMRIPLKASQPLWLSSEQKAISGSGTARSDGSEPSPARVTITGAAPTVNPTVTVGSRSFTWTGTVGAGDTLVVDGDKKTVVYNGVTNSLNGFSGDFPVIEPGDNTVTAPSTATIEWRDRWL